MEKTTVAFFLPTMDAGGAESNIVKILSGIDKKKFQPQLVLAKKQGDFLKYVPKNCRIFELGGMGYFKIFWGLAKFLKTEKPTILVSSFPHFNIISLAAKKFSGAETKIVVIEHTSFSLLKSTASNFWHKIIVILFLPALMRITYEWAGAIVCVSKGVASDLFEVLESDKKIQVIYNPVADGKILKMAQRQANHPWLADKNIPVIIAVGRLAKAKDYPNLFKALKLILEEHPAKLLILGSGAEEQKLKKIVEDYGLAEFVDFLGFQPNPYKYIKDSSVFVLSSMQEGFGNAIIEAMALGVPVVSTNCPSGPNEIIENNKNGILVPVKDPKSLAAGVLKILENPALAESFSKEGKKRSQFFSVLKSIKEYEKLFSKI